MAARFAVECQKTNKFLRNVVFNIQKNHIHLTPICSEVQSGKYKITPRRNRPLTYEMACKPYHIAHKKSWNSWNTTALKGGMRQGETAIEDMFIRKFMVGTFPGLCSEVIIKRQHNIIRIAAIVTPRLFYCSFCFLIGYTEELLSYWFQSPVKLELQVVKSNQDVTFKYI